MTGWVFGARWSSGFWNCKKRASNLSPQCLPSLQNAGSATLKQHGSEGQIVLAAGSCSCLTLLSETAGKCIFKLQICCFLLFRLLSSSMPCLLSCSLLSFTYILVLPSSMASFCDLLSFFVCFFLLPLATSCLQPACCCLLPCELFFFRLLPSLSFCFLPHLACYLACSCSWLSSFVCFSFCLSLILASSCSPCLQIFCVLPLHWGSPSDIASLARSPGSLGSANILYMWLGRAYKLRYLSTQPADQFPGYPSIQCMLHPCESCECFHWTPNNIYI